MKRKSREDDKYEKKSRKRGKKSGDFVCKISFFTRIISQLENLLSSSHKVLLKRTIIEIFMKLFVEKITDGGFQTNSILLDDIRRENEQKRNQERNLKIREVIKIVVPHEYLGKITPFERMIERFFEKCKLIINENFEKFLCLDNIMSYMNPALLTVFILLINKLYCEFGFFDESKYSIIQKYYCFMIYSKLVKEYKEDLRENENLTQRIFYSPDEIVERTVDNERRVLVVGETREYYIVVGYFSDREVFISRSRVHSVQYYLIHPFVRNSKYPTTATTGNHLQNMGNNVTLEKIRSKLTSELLLSNKKEMDLLISRICKNIEFLNQYKYEENKLQQIKWEVHVEPMDGLSRRLHSTSSSYKTIFMECYVEQFFMDGDIGVITRNLISRIRKRRVMNSKTTHQHRENWKSYVLKYFESYLDIQNGSKFLNCYPQYLLINTTQELLLVRDFIRNFRRIPKFENYDSFCPEEEKIMFFMFHPLLETFLESFEHHGSEANFGKNVLRLIEDLNSGELLEYFESLPSSSSISSSPKKKKRNSKFSFQNRINESKGIENAKIFIRVLVGKFLKKHEKYIISVYFFLSLLLCRDILHIEKWSVMNIWTVGLFQWQDVKYSSEFWHVGGNNDSKVVWDRWNETNLVNHKIMNFQGSIVGKKLFGRPRGIEYRDLNELGYLYRIDDISKGKEVFPVVLENCYDFIPFYQFKYCTVMNFRDYEEEVCHSSRTNDWEKCNCLNTMREKKLDVHYDDSGRLIFLEKEKCKSMDVVIRECGNLCSCSSLNRKCMNKICQSTNRGWLVYIEKNKNKELGWNVISLKNIKVGEFLAEYKGEIIRDVVAEQRGKFYDWIGLSYLYDLTVGLKKEVDDNSYSVDAYDKGNFTRFLNHSCNPTLHPMNFTVGTRNQKAVTRVGFFAWENINIRCPLTYNYNYQLNADISKRKQCFCGEENCRLYFR